MAQLIAVDCPHCGATLPAREPDGHYRCDYCGTRFKAIETPSAKTQAGIRITAEQLAKMVEAERAARPAPAQRPAGSSKVLGLVIAAVVLSAVLGTVISMVSSFSGMFGDDDDGPKRSKPSGVETSPAEPDDEDEDDDEGEEKEKEPEEPAGLGLDEMATLDNESWNAVGIPGMEGSFEAFRPIASAAWATKIARAWSPDARLDYLSIDRVTPDGRVSVDGREGVDYRFYSPARRKSAKAMMEVSEKKVVSEFRIWISKGEVRVMQSSLRSPSREDRPHAELGKCTLAQVMEKLRSAGLPTRPVYKLSLRYHKTDGYRWIASFRGGRSGSIPEVNAATCEPVGGNVPPPRDKFQTLKGCGCQAQLDGKAEAVQLAVRVLGGGTTMRPGRVERVFAMGYYLDIGSRKPWLLPVKATTAPPAKLTGSARFGLVCHGDLLVVVAERHVTAWSLSARAHRWTAELGGRYPRPAGARSNELNLACQVLKVGGGKLVVPLMEGGSVTLDVATGATSK